jgi:hypothetical protein
MPLVAFAFQPMRRIQNNGDSSPSVARPPVLCRICGKPVPLETAKTDEGGKAVHEYCHVLKLRLAQATKDINRP